MNKYYLYIICAWLFFSVTHHEVRLCENPPQLFSLHVFWVTGDCFQHLFGSLNSITGWISDLWRRPCVDLVIKLQQTNDIILQQKTIYLSFGSEEVLVRLDCEKWSHGCWLSQSKKLQGCFVVSFMVDLAMRAPI